jgi:hypothetical protein
MANLDVSQVLTLSNSWAAKWAELQPKKRSRKPLRKLRLKKLQRLKRHLQKKKVMENKCTLLDSACSLLLPVVPPGCT